MATRLFPSGAWEISDGINRKVYFGYTKRDAMRLFRAEFPKVK